MSEQLISVRHYECPQVVEHEVRKGKVELKEIGPRWDMAIRRIKISSEDVFKAACKKTKNRK